MCHLLAKIHIEAYFLPIKERPLACSNSVFYIFLLVQQPKVTHFLEWDAALIWWILQIQNGDDMKPCKYTCKRTTNEIIIEAVQQVFPLFA